MNKTAALKILTALIKVSPQNKILRWDRDELSRAIKNILKDSTRYKRHLESGKFIIKNAKANGRVYKCLHLVSANSGFHIPLTKNKLAVCFSKGSSNSTSRAKVVAALREAIAYQIDDYRVSIKNLKKELLKAGFRPLVKELNICPLSGKILGSGQIHVDHKIEFIKLLDLWISSTPWKKFVEIPHTVKYNKAIIDKKILDSWEAFHKEHCVLQLTSAKANVKKGSGGYRSSY